MNFETFNHADRSGFLERLGRLSGSTTWREPGGAGYTPYVSTSIMPNNAMLLALSMARRNAKDVGPEVAYSVGTGAPHQRARVVYWLAEKLLTGTGKTGRNNRKWLSAIAGHAYDAVIGIDPAIKPVKGAERDSILLANIGAGWLWMAMEAAVERAEAAMYGEGRMSRAWAQEPEPLTSRG